MDILAATFGVFLIVVSVMVTYRWGIKPEREAKKFNAQQARAEMRRQHSERLRRHSA